MAAIPISTDALRMEINAILKNSDLSTTSSKYIQQEIEGKYQVDLSDRKKEIDDLVSEYMQMIEAAKGQKRPSTDGYEDYNDSKRMKNEYNVGSSYEDWNRSQSQQQSQAQSQDSPHSQQAAHPHPQQAHLQQHLPQHQHPLQAGAHLHSPLALHHAHMSHSMSHMLHHGMPHGIPSAIPHGVPTPLPQGTNMSHGMAQQSVQTHVTNPVPLPKRGGTGFTKVCTLSPELAAIVGKDTMARHEVVKKMWSIIKERNLYDPTNKQFAICDEELFKVFGVERFRTFGMMKYLKAHFIN